MRTATLSLTVVVACFELLGAAHDPTRTDPGVALPSPGQGPDVGRTIVRAEYFHNSGNVYDLKTVCHIGNVSFSQPIVLGDVIILDPGGKVMATHAGLKGTVVPPLGRVNLPIDYNINGLVRQTGATPAGMSVLVLWSGPARSLKLSADIERVYPRNTADRAHIHVEGHDVIP